MPVKYRLLKNRNGRVLVEFSQNLPEPVKNSLAFRFCSVCKWLFRPLQVFFKFLPSLIKPYRNSILYGCIFTCLILIVIKIIAYLVLKVGIVFNRFCRSEKPNVGLFQYVCSFFDNFKLRGFNGCALDTVLFF